MTDPVFLIATTGLSVSAIVTAIRLINWFLHSDPKAIAQTGRLTAAGLFVLSLPLLLGLALNQRWAEAIGLSAVLLLALALYGPRVVGQLWPRRLVADWSPGGSRYATSEAADGVGRDTDLVERSIAVLEEYLRSTARVSGRNGMETRSDRSQITHAPAQSQENGHQENGHQGNGHDGGAGSLLMAQAEAFEVLGLGSGATESEINEAHRRLMQLIHPDRGGSPYFAVKLNQAKEVLLGRNKPQSGRSASAGPRKRRRHTSQQDVAQPKPTTRG
jgi:DnaJ domain